MPRMDGEEALKAMLDIYPGAKILLSSGFNEEDMKGRFNSGELGGFIQKPYGPADLKETLMAVLAH